MDLEYRLKQRYIHISSFRWGMTPSCRRLYRTSGGSLFSARCHVSRAHVRIFQTTMCPPTSLDDKGSRSSLHPHHRRNESFDLVKDRRHSTHDHAQSSEQWPRHHHSERFSHHPVLAVSSTGLSRVDFPRYKDRRARRQKSHRHPIHAT